MRALFLISTFLLISFCSFSQNNAKIDSLKAQLQKILSDTIRINLLLSVADKYSYQKPDSAMYYATQALEIAEKLALSANEGTVLWVASTKRIAKAYIELGWDYHVKGNYPEALKNFFTSLKVSEENNFKRFIASALGNIGSVYQIQGDYPKALKHYFEALKINNELGLKTGMAAGLSNIGIVYRIQGDYPKALKYYFEALEIDKELGRKSGMAFRFGNIGGIYRIQGDYPKALKYFFEALEIDKELGNKSGITRHLGNIGSLYTEQKKYKEAEEYLLQALAIDTTIGYLLHTENTHEQLATLYTQTQNYPLALKHYKQYTITKDSLFNEEKSKDIGRLEQTHEFEIAEMERMKQEEEQARTLAEQTERRNQLQYSGIVLVLVGLFIGIFIFARRFRKIKEYKTFQKYTKIVEAALFISFLIFFEFILVVLDPYIDQITGGAPLWKLGFNALLAGIIFPIHSLFETKLKGQVIKTERKKWVAEAVKGKNLLVVIGLGLVLVLNSGFERIKADSLKNQLVNSKSDNIKLKYLLDLADEYLYDNPDTSCIYATRALKVAESINDKQNTAQSYLVIGNSHWARTNNTKALENYQSALNIFSEIKDQAGIASAHHGIGIIYSNKTKYSQALQHFFEAVKIYRSINDTLSYGYSSILGNIGIIYNYQADYLNALKYYFRWLYISKEIEHNAGAASACNNIGSVYQKQKDEEKALEYFNKAIQTKQLMNDTINMNYANMHGNLGSIYQDHEQFNLALESYQRALTIFSMVRYQRGVAQIYNAIGLAHLSIYDKQLGKSKSISSFHDIDSIIDTAMYYQEKSFSLHKELNDDYGITQSLGSIAATLMRKKKYNKALVHYLDAVERASKIGALKLESTAQVNLSECYLVLNNHKLALEHYRQYSTLKDSVFNEKKSKDLGKLEAKHEFEMAELQKKQAEEEQAKVQAAIISRRNNLQHSAILIGIFILFGSLFLLGKLSIPNWLVELSVFIPFLILFEFLLVLLDPSIESWAGNEPAYKLLFNAGLAGMMFPLHQFFEGKQKKRIVKAQRLKLKKRMEQFKRDVEEM